MTNEATTHYNNHDYEKVVEVLGRPEQLSSLNHEDGLMLCRSYISIGDYQKALETARLLLKNGHSDDALTSIVNSYASIVETIESGIQQIEHGQHTSHDISFLKDYTSRLIEHKAFLAAINLLHRLAEARKAKTTNVVWIGQHLNEIYFAEGAESLKPRFDEKLLLDEVIFYYLKACKLFEPGYKVIQDHLKKVKAEMAAASSDDPAN